VLFIVFYDYIRMSNSSIFKIISETNSKLMIDFFNNPESNVNLIENNISICDCLIFNDQINHIKNVIDHSSFIYTSKFNDILDKLIQFRNFDILMYCLASPNVKLDNVCKLKYVMDCSGLHTVDMNVYKTFDINFVDGCGNNILMSAIMNKKSEVVNNLLKLKFDLTHKNNYGQNVLCCALVDDFDNHIEDHKFTDQNALINDFNFAHYMRNGNLPFRHHNAQNMPNIIVPNVNIPTLLLEEIIKLDSAKIKSIIDIALTNGNSIINCIIDKYPKYVAHLITHIDVNIKNIDGITPLIYAIKSDNYEIFKMLLNDNNIDVNIKDNNSESILFWAIKKCIYNDSKSWYYINDLVKHDKLDINICNIYGDTPLMYCIKKYHTNENLFSLLLRHTNINPNIPNYNGEIPIFYTFNKNYRSLFNLLMANKNCDPNIKNKNGDSLLLHIVKTFNVPKIKESKPISITNFKPEYASSISKYNNQENMLDVDKYSNGISLEADDWFSVSEPTSVNNNSTNFKNASYDIRGISANPKFTISPWLSASIEPDTNINTRMPDLTTKNLDNMTHLYEEQVRHFDMTSTSYAPFDKFEIPKKELIVDVPDKHMYFFNNLINNINTNVNMQDNYGNTALIYSCLNKLNMIYKLLEHKSIDLNIKNYIEQDTALIIACKNKFLHEMKLLLDKKADVTVKNRSGHTVNDIVKGTEIEYVFQNMCISKTKSWF